MMKKIVRCTRALPPLCIAHWDISQTRHIYLIESLLFILLNSFFVIIFNKNVRRESRYPRQLRNSPSVPLFQMIRGNILFFSCFHLYWLLGMTTKYPFKFMFAILTCVSMFAETICKIALAPVSSEVR